MRVARLYKTEAIVLRHHRLGEADHILTLYTPFLGKIRAVAKGVLRPRSRLGGHVELLTRCAMLLAVGRELDVVTQSQTLESYLPLRNDLWRTSLGLYAAELVDAFTPERLASERLYDLLAKNLQQLCREGGIELVPRSFEMGLLEATGYRPELYLCLQCQRELSPGAHFFSASVGGALCTACGPDQLGAQPLSLNALKVLRLLQRTDVSQLPRLHLPPELAAELEAVLRGYIVYLLEREPRSIAFLDTLRA